MGSQHKPKRTLRPRTKESMNKRLLENDNPETISGLARCRKKSDAALWDGFKPPLDL